MRIAHQYKLKPTKDQVELIDRWLELSRRIWNYRLRQRLDWLEINKCDVFFDGSCNRCAIPEKSWVLDLEDLEFPILYRDGKDKVHRVAVTQKSYQGKEYTVDNWEGWQVRDLASYRQTQPELLEIPSHTLNQIISNLDKTWWDWMTGKCGKPRFKKRGEYRSINFPDQKTVETIVGDRIRLPKIGWLRIKFHRPIPDGFVIKTAEIVRKADGLYITLSLYGATVEIPQISTPTLDNTIGIDVGLNSFLTTDDCSKVGHPHYFGEAQKQIAKLNRELARAKKGSNRRKKVAKKLALAHQHIANQRKDFHYNTAKQLLSQEKHIAHEKLKIKPMSKRLKAKQNEAGQFEPNGQTIKTELINKPIHDAGWGQFLTILGQKAERYGLSTIPVDPNRTTMNCPKCRNTADTKLGDRWYSCKVCGLEMDIDQSAAINIKNRALEAIGK